jgi:hypothetical protein
MTTEFTIHQKGDNHPERSRKRAAFHTRVKFKLDHATGPFTISRDGGDRGPSRTSAEVYDRVRVWTKQGKVGSRFDIIAQDTVFNLKTVEVAPPIPAPNTSPIIAKWYVRVFTKHGYVTNLGNWYCRYIAGTRIVSRHGYHAADDSWFGDAQDFGCPTSDLLSALADEIVRALEDPSDELHMSLSHVIVHDRIWENGNWSHYSGEYHYHVHIDNNAGVPCSP